MEIAQRLREISSRRNAQPQNPAPNSPPSPMTFASFSKDYENYPSLGTLKIKLEEIRGHFVGNLAKMGKISEIAFKSVDSYFTINQNSKSELIDKGSLIYSNERSKWLKNKSGVVYYRPMNCYFFNYFGNLYRKDIDSKPPHLFLSKFRSPVRNWTYMIKASVVNSLLLVLQENDRLVVVDPRLKKTNAFLVKSGLEKIVDFELFGEKEDKVVILHSKCQVSICSLTPHEQILDTFDPCFNYKAAHQPYSIQLCQRNRFFAITPRRNAKFVFKCGFAIFEVTDDSKLKLRVKMMTEDIASSFVRIVGYSQNFLVFLSFSKTFEDNWAWLFGFDLNSGRIVSMKDRAVQHGGELVKWIQRVGYGFYFSTPEGKMIKLIVIK